MSLAEKSKNTPAILVSHPSGLFYTDASLELASRDRVHHPAALYFVLCNLLLVCPLPNYSPSKPCFLAMNAFCGEDSPMPDWLLIQEKQHIKCNKEKKESESLSRPRSDLVSPWSVIQIVFAMPTRGDLIKRLSSERR